MMAASESGSSSARSAMRSAAAPAPRMVNVMAPEVLSMAVPATGSGVCSGRTDRISPAEPRLPWRRALSRWGGTAGTLRLRTVAGVMPASTGTMPQTSPTGVSHGTGSSPQAMLTARPRTPSCAARARVQRGPTGIDTVVDARHHQVGPGAEPLDAGQDDRQRRWPVDAVGGEAVEPGDLDCLERERLALVDGPDGCSCSAVVGERGHQYQIVSAIEGGGEAA